MTNAVKIFLPDHTEVSVVVGKDGVSKIFTDKEYAGTIVILQEDNIVTYTGFPFILQKDYKKEN